VAALPSPLLIMKKYSNNKEINQLVKELVKNNWQFKFGSKHGRIESPVGIKFTVPKSPSDWRAAMNFKCAIERLNQKVVNYG
jgi:hypothetical protein